MESGRKLDRRFGADEVKKVKAVGGLRHKLPGNGRSRDLANQEEVLDSTHTRTKQCVVVFGKYLMNYSRSCMNLIKPSIGRLGRDKGS